MFQTKDDLTLQVAKSSGKTELEDFGGSNTNAVHKASFLSTTLPHSLQHTLKFGALQIFILNAGG